MKNKIIYIGAFELPDKNAAAHRVLGNAKIFRELGYEVIFIDIDRAINMDVINTQSEIQGFTRYSRQNTGKRFYSISDFCRICDCYKNEIFAVVAYNYPSLGLLKMKHFCKKNKMKLFADITEWYGFLGDSFVKNLYRGADSFFRMRCLHFRLDGVIVISSYLKNYYAGKVPVVMIPPLVDIEEEKWKTVERKRNSKLQIVYAGSPGKHKDKIDRLVKAIYALKDTRITLVVIGLSEEQFLKYYPNCRKILNIIGKQVIFKGKLPHEEALYYIKISDFSMFYRNVTKVTMAGFPTKFSESISCGIPVITNRTSDLKKYLKEGENGYWVNGDLENSLRRILNKNIDELRAIKYQVKKTTFDYRNYIKDMQIWIKSIMEKTVAK